MVGITGKLTLLSVAAAAFVYAQPSIDSGGVLNAASYALPGLANSGIAQGSMFIVFGRNMGPAAIQIVDRFPLSTTLAGTSVRYTSGGATSDCPIIYTLAGQVAALMPSNAQIGAGNVTVTFNGQTSAPSPVTVVKSSLGIFTRNQAGSGPAIVQNVNSELDRPTNALIDAAKPGQVMILWGTGLGPVTGNEAAGVVPGDLGGDVEVLIGGRSVKPTYAGRSGCCAGIDQVVFTVPAGIEGCYVPVAVRTGAVISNYTSISITSTGKNCSDPTGFSAADLEKARSGNFRVGSVVLSRINIKQSVPVLGTIEIKTDVGSASFVRFDLNSLLASTGAAALPPYGSCTIATAKSESPSGPSSIAGLDAGASLTVNGPKGSKTLTKTAGTIPGVYSAVLSSGTPGIPGIPGLPGLPGGGGSSGDYLDPGSYTITGPGGTDVGAFSARLTVPSLLTWSNQDAINDVTRSQGVTVNWTGGSPNDYVYIIGTSVAQSAKVTGTFTCLERASAGQFAVPAAVLANLPASETIQGVSTGNLIVGSSPAGEAARFTASNLDIGVAVYAMASSKSVNFK